MEQFFSNEFLSEMVQRINVYDKRTIAQSGPIRMFSALKRWTIVTTEVRKFIGLLLNSKFFKIEIFSLVLSRNSCEFILGFWHFGDQPEFIGDSLAIVRFVLNHFNNVMSVSFIPEKRLSLDESMMLWCGRLVFRHYMKNMRHKYGIKFFVPTMALFLPYAYMLVFHQKMWTALGNLHNMFWIYCSLHRQLL